jgi:hypothetical protein
MRWHAPGCIRNAPTRRMPCTSLARLPRGASRLRARRLKPITAKPLPWLRHWACARSWPTVTTGWARSMLR